MTRFYTCITWFDIKTVVAECENSLFGGSILLKDVVFFRKTRARTNSVCVFCVSVDEATYPLSAMLNNSLVSIPVRSVVERTHSGIMYVHRTTPSSMHVYRSSDVLSVAVFNAPCPILRSNVCYCSSPK